MVYVVDTHALVWFLQSSDSLGTGAREALQSEDAEIVIPAIALAEIAFLFGRHRIAVDVPSVLAQAQAAANCTIYPVDEAVVQRLPDILNIRDGLIVATALVYQEVLGKPATVVTKDAEIARSGLVATLW